MTEDEAKNWFADRYDGTTIDRLSQFLAMVAVENREQNLVAPSTIATIWARHAVDSAQLLGLAGRSDGRWIDIGSGGGFPGIVVALLSDFAVDLVEPRKRRAAFLSDCIVRLALDNASVQPFSIERISSTADIISARAVAATEKLLHVAQHCATPVTRWILPRGRVDDEETAVMRRCWQGMFHVEHSVTEPDSTIFILEGKLA